MPTCREVLNRFKWDPDRRFDDLTITYRHRGAPRDEATLPIGAVEELDRSFIVTDDDTHIPYHRVLRIERADGEAVWVRRVDHG